MEKLGGFLNSLTSSGSIGSQKFFGLRGHQETPPPPEQDVTSRRASREEFARIDRSSQHKLPNPEFYEEEKQQRTNNKPKVRWQNFAGRAKDRLGGGGSKNLGDSAESEEISGGGGSGGGGRRKGKFPTGPDDYSDDEQNVDKGGGENDGGKKGKKINSKPKKGTKSHGGAIEPVKNVNTTEGSKVGGPGGLEEIDANDGRLQLLTTDTCRNCFVCKAMFNFDPANECPKGVSLRIAGEFLPFNSGHVILLWPPINEDTYGFFQGELLDGKRGLVHLDFVPRLTQTQLKWCQLKMVQQRTLAHFGKILAG